MQKRIVFISTFLIFFINFPLHFLFDTFPNFFTLIFSPVNESIAEHMKMIFSSYFFASIILFLFTKDKRIFFANLLASLLGICLFLLMFIPFLLVFGSSMIFTFFFLFLAILASQIVSYYIRFYSKIKYQTLLFFGILLSFYIVSTYFTYFPPKLYYFYDRLHHTYGVTVS